MDIRVRIAVLCAATFVRLLAAHPVAAATKPNILFVLTDDQTVSLAAQMPNLKRLVAGRGATFTHAYYNDPLCGPSRATILTGRYKQNTGVDQNRYAQFAPHERETVAVALHDVGYRTALIGKYINGYPRSAGIPPGWDEWFVDLGNGPAVYNYKMDDNGKVVAFGSTPKDYRTDVLAGRAVSFVKQAEAAGAPFYLQLAVDAPHVPAVPAPRDANALPGLGVPRSAAFNEADVSDKPGFVRKRGPFGTNFIAQLDAGYRQQARELLAVDDAIGRLVDAIGPARLADTYVVFTSDNGWMRGEHRIPSGKGLPYEPVLRMPLFVSGPGTASGSRVDALVSNADLAPTFVDWAGTTMPAPVDGRSFALLLAKGGSGGRQAEPIGYLTSASADASKFPTWDGIKTTRYTYVEYRDGERELYDDQADPLQLTNIAGTATPGLLAALHARTATLQACAGATCRAAEDASLP
jgi:N-acetylglucosamine-6-sulfatase